MGCYKWIIEMIFEKDFAERLGGETEPVQYVGKIGDSISRIRWTVIGVIFLRYDPHGEDLKL
jgi:hypothetical protein